MKYILDTNALIYSLCNPAGLTKTASQIITTEKEIYVSIASFWEIAIKQSLGKLAINSTIPDIEKTYVKYSMIESGTLLIGGDNSNNIIYKKMQQFICI